MTDKETASLIQELKKVKGSLSYDGDASVQVLLPLKDGRYLRVGITDEDVADTPGLWYDFYEGLNGEIRKLAQQTNISAYLPKEKSK